MNLRPIDKLRQQFRVALFGISEVSKLQLMRDKFYREYPWIACFSVYIDLLVKKRGFKRTIVVRDKNLQQIIKQVPMSTKVISFDLFDTLVTRANLIPERVLLKSAEFLSLLLTREGWLVSREFVYRVRVAVERDLRDNSVRLNGLDPETKLENIISQIVFNITGSSNENIVKQAIEYEEKLELGVLRPTIWAHNALRIAAALNYKIILTSEMYLSKRLITSICEKFGFKRYFQDIFVSSEILRMKGTGKIYKYICDYYNIKPQEIFHVGDNINADIIPVINMGMNAGWLNVENHKYKVMKVEADLSKFEEKKLSVKKQKEVLAKFGLLPEYWLDKKYSQLESVLCVNVAPALCSFVAELYTKLFETNVKKVYFLAREGVTLKKAFDHYVKQNSLECPYIDMTTHLLYISRKIAYVLEYPGSWVPQRFLQITMSRTNDLSYESILNVWGLTVPELSQKAREEFEDISRGYFNYNLREALLEFFEHSRHFAKEVNTILNIRLDNASKYLQQEGVLTSGEIAIVDIGWIGSISNSIANYTKRRGLDTVIYTYLFATSPNHYIRQNVDPNLNLSIPGIIIDGGLNPIMFNRVTDCAAVLEVIYGDDSFGTTIDYKVANEIIIPITSNLNLTKENLIIQETARKVFIECIDKYIDAMNYSCISMSAVKQYYVNVLMSFLRKPTFNSVKPFEKCKLDLGTDQTYTNSISLIKKLSLWKIFTQNFLNTKEPYLWRRGSFAYSKFPSIIFKLYEIIFLMQIIYPGIYKALRKCIKWDPFAWKR